MNIDSLCGNAWAVFIATGTMFSLSPCFATAFWLFLSQNVNVIKCTDFLSFNVYPPKMGRGVHFINTEHLFQKNVVINFLTHKHIKNDGRVPQYYVVDSHPAIIAPELFDAVQREVERREAAKTRHSGTSIFAGKIICGDCGHHFGAKVWHSTDIYKRTVFQCNNKFKNGDKCKTPHLTEAEIKSRFVNAVNKLLPDKKKVIKEFNAIKSVIFDTTALDEEISKLDVDMDVLSQTMRAVIAENAATRHDQDEFNKRKIEIYARYDALKAERDAKDEKRQDTVRRKRQVEAFISDLKKQPDAITEFDPQLWIALLEDVTVYATNDVRFRFKDGTVIMA